MNREIWKDIKGYEGLYVISSLGVIKSLSRIVKMPRFKSFRKGRTIKQFESKNGYLRVTLSKDKDIKNFLVHRLVLTTFNDCENKNMQVNHINGNKLNNSLENLEWCTPKENINHSINELGKRKKPISQYGLNGDFITNFNSIKEASETLNIKQSGISACLRGLQKTSRGYKWKYNNN